MYVFIWNRHSTCSANNRVSQIKTPRPYACMHGENVEFGNLIPGNFAFGGILFAILRGKLFFPTLAIRIVVMSAATLIIPGVGVMDRFRLRASLAIWTVHLVYSGDRSKTSVTHPMVKIVKYTKKKTKIINNEQTTHPVTKQTLH